MTSATETASETTTTRLREPERVRLRWATRPGTPKSAWAILPPTCPRCLRMRTVLDWRMASTALARLAFTAGTKAETSRVTSDSRTATSKARQSSVRLTVAVVCNREANSSLIAPSVTAVPAMPSARPAGMPTAPSNSASTRTDWRSCLALAPMPLSRPSWRVRSVTEMAKAV